MKKMILTLCAVLVGLSAFAQKGNIGFVYPSGARQGTTVEITVGGQNISKAKAVFISGEGVTGELIPAPKAAKKKGKGRKKKDIGEEDNLQLADQVRFRLTIAPDAAVGMRNLRLILPNGWSNRLYFEIGELPDVLEKAGETISATSEKLPVCFNGQIMRSDVDRFRFLAKKGKDMVIKVKGREFVPYIADAVPGWFQPIIRLYGPDGKEITYNDDYRFNVDPVIIFKVPETGYYDVEINDALYRGREDFVYRMEVGELPFITGITPIGSVAGKKVQVSLRGVNLKSRSIRFNAGKPGRKSINVRGSNGLSSNSLGFDVSPFQPLQTKRLKPNTSSDAAWALEEGMVVEQNFSEKLQQHWYSFEVEKNHLVNLDIVARRLGAPTDARITVFDSKAQVIQDIDDVTTMDEPMMTHFADPSVCFKAARGTYYIRVMESQGHFGADFSYRLSIDRASPDFSLRIEPSTISVPENGTGVFNVEVSRKQKFGGEISLDVSGLPRGYKVRGNVIEKGQKKTFVSITAPEGAEHKVILPKVTGAASQGGVSISREAVPAEAMMQAFYYTHLLPVDEFRVEVGGELPFRLIPEDISGMKLRNGDTTSVKVRIERKEGFNSPVTVMLKSTFALKAEAEVIPGDRTECTLNMVTKSKAVRDRNVAVYFTGVVKGSSGRIAGKDRKSFVASVMANSPVQNLVVAGSGANRKKGGAKAVRSKKK